MKIVLISLFLICFSTTRVHASDSTGVYGKIDSVTKMNCLGTSIAKICGSMAMSFIPSEGNDYKGKRTFDALNGEYYKPENGCLYYSCPKGQEQECSNQWRQIKQAGKEGKCVGFNSRRGKWGPGMLLKPGDPLQITPFFVLDNVYNLDAARCAKFSMPESSRNTRPNNNHN
ncbi:MAG: hypothetical protein FJ116_07050 [Deltaproteobacteria bacterium]|nr:hypothetical protein [Deltaproteobacteria bacterium]